MAKREPKRNDKLERWQERLAEGNRAFDDEVQKMDTREDLYNGDRSLRALVQGDAALGDQETPHVRNIVFENIESQVSSSIPQPKVTARRKEDEHLAELIEHMLRNELDRLPMEELNDMAERTVPLQGGVGFSVEWDSGAGTEGGELQISAVHPKLLAPQPGVYTGIPDMDWVIVKIPTTKGQVKRRYGVEMPEESEAEPALRSTEGDTARDAVTMNVGYERGERGINKYVWVNDTELEDLEDYQARRQPVCRRCGRVRPLAGQVIAGNAGTAFPYQVGVPGSSAGAASPGEGSEQAPGPEEEGLQAGRAMAAWLAESEEPGLLAIPVGAGEPPKEPTRYDGGPCPWCGGTDWSSEIREYEEVFVPFDTGTGLHIPGMHNVTGEDGKAEARPTLIPYYKPDVYPIVLQRSVSVYGKLLGTSDADVIQDQQNTVNRLEKKIIDRLMEAGSLITLPMDAQIRTDPRDGKKIYLRNAADKNLIDVYTFSGDLSYEMAYLAQTYEESRQLLGITDSFQGRRDTTATSGKAKEFSAAQAAGRLESKRVMKDAAYARIFELMFKFWLAYADAPRTVSWSDSRGDVRYGEISRYDFLERDEDGGWRWNDRFLFSVDAAATLAANREAMWQETRMNLQTGAFGDPTRTETLILFWGKMEELHYPGAGQTKKFLEERAEKEREAMQEQAGLLSALPNGPAGTPGGTTEARESPLSQLR